MTARQIAHEGFEVRRQSTPGLGQGAWNVARRLIATPGDAGAAIARLALALLIFPHGAQHALGWFGGYGFSGTHAANGFFMNWFGSHPAGQEGFEYHLAILALCAIIAVKGSGALSLDRHLTR